MAIFAAELVIDIYEKKYPNDNWPGNAIRAAKQYLDDSEAAGAAGAAEAAGWAARAAAWAAGDDSAAAKKEIIKKCDEFIISILDKKKDKNEK